MIYKQNNHTIYNQYPTQPRDKDCQSLCHIFCIRHKSQSRKSPSETYFCIKKEEINTKWAGVGFAQIKIGKLNLIKRLWKSDLWVSKTIAIVIKEWGPNGIAAVKVFLHGDFHTEILQWGCANVVGICCLGEQTGVKVVPLLFIITPRGPSRQFFGQISAQNLSKIPYVWVKVWTKQAQKSAYSRQNLIRDKSA